MIFHDLLINVYYIRCSVLILENIREYIYIYFFIILLEGLVYLKGVMVIEHAVASV